MPHLVPFGGHGALNIEAPDHALFVVGLDRRTMSLCSQVAAEALRQLAAVVQTDLDVGLDFAANADMRLAYFADL